MGIQIADREIERVAIIDDDSESRESVRIIVEDLSLHPLVIDGPLESLDETWARLCKLRFDAVISDFHLRKQNYSHFNGDEIVSRCYKKKVPALLWSAVAKAIGEVPSDRKRNIAAFLPVESLDLEPIRAGFSKCVSEFNGKYMTDRKAYRTQIGVVERDNERKIVYLLLPGWNPGKRIPVSLSSVPEELRDELTPGKWYFAWANIGAKDSDEIFICGWEF